MTNMQKVLIAADSNLAAIMKENFEEHLVDTGISEFFFFFFRVSFQFKKFLLKFDINPTELTKE